MHEITLSFDRAIFRSNKTRHLAAIAEVARIKAQANSIEKNIANSLHFAYKLRMKLIDKLSIQQW